jgi:protein ImuB
MAAACFELGWQCSDGQIGRLYFNLSRPGRDRAILHRLLAGATERIDVEFGIDYSWLYAHKLAAEMEVTGLLGEESTHPQNQQIDHVLDILAAKLGADKVQHVICNSRWQISDNTAYQKLADRNGDASWHAPAPASLTPPRPIRLFEPAEPVHVVALLPDHPPAMLRWRKKSWQICRATGPERIGPRWWDTEYKGVKTRDYYRVETSSGMRLWVYREGLPERGESVEWFVHGCFS